MSERVKITTKTPESKRDNSVSRIRKTDSSHSLSSPIDQILVLQRTIGNQAVQRLLKSGVIQAKLRIGQPNDKYEQEADRVADEVMRMPEPGLQRQVEPEEEEEEETLQPKPLVSQITPLVQVQRQEEPEEEEEELQAKPLSEQITPLVQRQVEPEEEEEEEAIQTKLVDGMQVQRQEEPEEEEEEEPIQTKQVSTRAPAVTPNLASRIQSLKGGGQPLPRSVRAFFEPRFGHNFSHVRVHTDAKAAESARGLNAKAFTVGRNIVFGAGQYAPGISSSNKLLAHELTHVIQQATSKNMTYIRCRRTGRERLFVKNRYFQCDHGLFTLPGAGTRTLSYTFWYRIYEVKKGVNISGLYRDLRDLYVGDRFLVHDNTDRKETLGTQVPLSPARFFAIYPRRTSMEPVNLKYLRKYLKGQVSSRPQLERIGITKKFVGYKDKAWNSLSSKAGNYANSWSTWTLRGLDEFLKTVSFKKIKRRRQINKILAALGNITWALASFIPGISVTRTIGAGLISLVGAMTAVFASITSITGERRIRTQIRRIQQIEIAKHQAKIQDQRLLGPILIAVFVKSLDRNLSPADRDALLWNHMFSIPYGTNRYNIMWKRVHNRLSYLFTRGTRRAYKYPWIP